MPVPCVFDTPSDIAEPIKLGELALPAESVRTEARFFTLEQVRQIIQRYQEPFHTMFNILAMTGIRAGELLGLKVDDVDFERRLIFIRRSVNRGHVQTVKSKASQNLYRFLTLSPKFSGHISPLGGRIPSDGCLQTSEIDLTARIRSLRSSFGLFWKL